MVEKLLQLLKPVSDERQNIASYTYALIDGVKHKMLWSDLEEGLLEYDLLFREESLRKELFTVAPYLVHMEFVTPEAEEQSIQILKQCYGANSTIFISSDLEFEDVLDRIREMFYLYTHEGIKGYMRLYDPKIFHDYISQKDRNIQDALFDGIVCYWCEEPDNISMIWQYLKKHTSIPIQI